MENEDTPEQPQILGLIREARRLGVPFFNGAIWDLPYIYRLEWNAALDAEVDYKNRQALNLKNKSDFLNAQKSQTTNSQ